MWPFTKKLPSFNTLQVEKHIAHLANVKIRVRVFLTEQDFETNLSRVKEVADALEPVLQLLRSQERKLMRLEKHNH